MTLARHVPGKRFRARWHVSLRGKALASRAALQTLEVVGEVLGLGIAAGPPTPVSWRGTLAEAVLEHAAAPGPSSAWHAATNQVHAAPATFNVDVTDPRAEEYFRLRQVQ